VALCGASVGCSVAIYTAVKQKVPVNSVVLMTPGKNYLGVPTMQHIKNWPDLPLLILSSEEESGKGADVIYKKLQNTGAELHLFDDEDIHGTYMFGEVDDVEDLIANWLAEKLN
jgi:hypothetical protein